MSNRRITKPRKFIRIEPPQLRTGARYTSGFWPVRFHTTHDPGEPSHDVLFQASPMSYNKAPSMGGSPKGRKPSTRVLVRGKRSYALNTAIFDPTSWTRFLQPVK